MAPIGFPYKLWKVLNISVSTLLKWSDDGTAVTVDEPRFDVLADKFFPTLLRVPSAVNLRRMFHLYCFSRTVPVDVDGNELVNRVEYSHPHFIRGRWDLMHRVSPRYPRYPAFLRSSENSSHRNRLLSPVSGAQKRREAIVAASSTLHPSVRSLEKLPLYRLPYHLNLDDDVDVSFYRSPTISPSVEPIRSYSTVEPGEGSHSLMLRDYQKSLQSACCRRAYTCDSAVDSLSTSTLRDKHLLTVKLRSGLKATYNENEPVVIDDDDAEEDDFDVSRTSGDLRIYDPSVVVGAHKAKTHNEVLFADENTTWFGLGNEPVVVKIRSNECDSDLKNVASWLNVNVLEHEHKVYADLDVVGTTYHCCNRA